MRLLMRLQLLALLLAVRLPRAALLATTPKKSRVPWNVSRKVPVTYSAAGVLGYRVSNRTTTAGEPEIEVLLVRHIEGRLSGGKRASGWRRELLMRTWGFPGGKRQVAGKAGATLSDVCARATAAREVRAKSCAPRAPSATRRWRCAASQDIRRSPPWQTQSLNSSVTNDGTTVRRYDGGARS